MVFDAYPRMDSIGRYINHSTKPNLQLMKPINCRGRLRIGFVAAKDIDCGEELYWNYGFDRRNGELPPWYKNTGPQVAAGLSMGKSSHDSEPEPAPAPKQPAAVESKVKGRKEVTCMVPGCGMRVKKIWNHLNQSKRHADLTKQQRGYYLSLSHAASQPQTAHTATIESAASVDGAPLTTMKLTIKSIGRQAYGSTYSMKSHAMEGDLKQFHQCVHCIVVLYNRNY